MSGGNDLNKNGQKEAEGKSLLERLSDAVELNLTNDQFGVDSLAQIVGMSRSSLHRKLHKTAGVSTSQFIREYRLKRALEILRTEDITASETAFRVGFSSATYFSTSFHKFYGYPPGETKSRDIKELDLPSSKGGLLVIKERKVGRILFFVLPCLLGALAFLYYYNTQVDIKESQQVAANSMEDKSIAVLPLKNWTGNSDLESVSDGMTDAIVTRLSKISSLGKVTPFTSTLTYKESIKSVKEISRELDVKHLLEGNLQISGNEVKIILKLTDGSSNEHIWSEEYTRDWKSDEILRCSLK